MKKFPYINNLQVSASEGLLIRQTLRTTNSGLNIETYLHFN